MANRFQNRRSKKYIHLFEFDQDEKFSIPLYHFLKDDFAIDEHYFYIPQHNNMKLKLCEDNVEYFNYDLAWAIRFFVQSFFCQKIIIHKIPHNTYFFVLFLMFPFLARKSAWIIWGGDLYYHELRAKGFKSNLVELFRRIIIRKFKFLITPLDGDFELARKRYNAKGKHISSFVYPSNLFKSLDLNHSRKDNRVIIQIGNSACRTNKHLELLEDLKFLRDENILLYCPLSYSGRDDYINEVIEKGYEVFGREKFIPLLEFLPHQEYLDFLSNIDVTIFNHDRQRGLGNITSLLSLGKKVYMRESITTWEFCVQRDLRVFSIDKDLHNVLHPMPEFIKKHNIGLVKSMFSLNQLISQWSEVLES